MADAVHPSTARPQRGRSASDEAFDPSSFCACVQTFCAAIFGVSRDGLTARTRGSASVATVRQVAMYLAHVTGDLSLTAVGRQFGRDRTTAAHACRRIEAMRDRPEIERCLDHLERLCRRFFGPTPEAAR